MHWNNTNCILKRFFFSERCHQFKTLCHSHGIYSTCNSKNVTDVQVMTYCNGTRTGSQTVVSK